MDLEKALRLVDYVQNSALEFLEVDRLVRGIGPWKTNSGDRGVRNIPQGFAAKQQHPCHGRLLAIEQPPVSAQPLQVRTQLGLAGALHELL